MKKVRVAVIGRTGRGNYGHDLDRVWLQIPEVQIVAVADENEAGLAAAVKRLGAERGYADYRQMLDEVRPQVVSICPRWIDVHHAMAMACAERGIHMYLEKPFCRTLAEADEIIRTCEQTHTCLAISHQTRYSPMIPVVEQLIADGKLGRILEYRARGKEDKRGGAEDLWVLGTHLMDQIRLFGGHPLACSTVVTAGDRPITKADVVEGNEGIGLLAGDAVRAMYTMPAGSTAYFNSVRNAGGKPPRFGLHILGTAGVLEMQSGYLPSVKFLADPSWSPGRSGAAWQNVSTAGIGQPEPLKDGGLIAGNELIARDLLASIDERRQPLGNMYEARGALEMIVAVFASQQAGETVSFPWPIVATRWQNLRE